MNPLTTAQRKFVDYLLDFYGGGGVYTKSNDPFSTPMTRLEASRAARALSKTATFEGDTIDREKARELVLHWREGKSARPKTGQILYSTPRGHITLEPAGKGLAYIVWLNGTTAATRMHTIGINVHDAFERAKDKLK